MEMPKTLILIVCRSIIFITYAFIVASFDPMLHEAALLSPRTDTELISHLFRIIGFLDFVNRPYF
jgi:hypothetical protein